MTLHYPDLGIASVGANFPHSTTNKKHYPDLVTGIRMDWFLRLSLDLISRGKWYLHDFRGYMNYLIASWEVGRASRSITSLSFRDWATFFNITSLVGVLVSKSPSDCAVVPDKRSKNGKLEASYLLKKKIKNSKIVPSRPSWEWPGWESRSVYGVW